ncbi:MAG: class I SAM-dependent methyltransferase [Candidatus Atribacteria bacterium]
MNLNEGITTREVIDCFLCQKRGALLYEQQRDRLFSAPGDWNFFQCHNCGLVWLNPQPIPDEIEKLYTTYYTHGPETTSLYSRLRDAVLLTEVRGNHLLEGIVWRFLGIILYSIPPIRSAAHVATMHLGRMKKGRLLDVGCGGGRFLKLMWNVGWKVQGLELDKQAAESTSRRLDMPVHVGTVEQADFGESFFDVITINHVIEHLIDPIATLQACRRILTTGGRIVIVTPNVESLGHCHFQSSWRALEPPRHIHLFSLRTLSELVRRAGFNIEILYTSPRNAMPSYMSSMAIRAMERKRDDSPGLRGMIRGLLFAWVERVANAIWKNRGEEIVLVATTKTGTLSFCDSRTHPIGG